MDKNNSREPRIESAADLANNRAMEDALLSRAFELAERTFTDPTEDHVTGLFSQLLWNYKHGMGEQGVGTVH